MSPALTRRQRWWLWVRIAVFGLALLLMLFAVGSPRGFAVSILPLELAGSAAAFKAVVLQDWLQAPLVDGTAASFWRLRGNLFVDSVLFVPGYVSLLVFFTLAFGPPLLLHPTRRQLLCVPAVAAGLFDIAENGMTGRALDDLVEFALVDTTVADVSLAARIKWMLLGLALAVLAWRALATAVADKPWRAVAAALCALAAPAFVVGGAMSSPGVITAGLGAALLGCGLLCARTLRAAP
jgi:hypothetical protein